MMIFNAWSIYILHFNAIKGSSLESLAAYGTVFALKSFQPLHSFMLHRLVTFPLNSCYLLKGSDRALLSLFHHGLSSFLFLESLFDDMKPYCFFDVITEGET